MSPGTTQPTALSQLFEHWVFTDTVNCPVNPIEALLLVSAEDPEVFGVSKTCCTHKINQMEILIFFFVIVKCAMHLSSPGKELKTD